jgi:hypothetical protein
MAMKSSTATSKRLSLFNGQQNASTVGATAVDGNKSKFNNAESQTGSCTVFSDRFIEDGSNIRLKTLNVGYSLPKSILDKSQINTREVVCDGQNLLTWTNYTGYDPEITSGDNTTQQGTDTGIYPVFRSISGGLTVTF